MLSSGINIDEVVAIAQSPYYFGNVHDMYMTVRVVKLVSYHRHEFIQFRG